MEEADPLRREGIVEISTGVQFFLTKEANTQNKRKTDTWHRYNICPFSKHTNVIAQLNLALVLPIACKASLLKIK